MIVHIFTKQNGEGIVADLNSRSERIEFAKSLLTEQLATLDFDSAIITSDNSDTCQFSNLQALIEELSKTK